MKNEYVLDLTVPPVGTVEKSHCKIGDSFYIRWAPGNGLAYKVVVMHLPSDIADDVGFTLLATLSTRNDRLLSIGLNPTGFIHKNYISEKVGDEISEESCIYYTALLNWVLYTDEMAMEYSMELYNEARNRWV